MRKSSQLAIPALAMCLALAQPISAQIVQAGATTQNAIATSTTETNTKQINTEQTSVSSIVPNSYDDTTLKKYAINFTSTPTDCRRLVKVSVKKAGVLNVLYSIETCLLYTSDAADE